MSTDTDKEKGSIDNAIEQCTKAISRNRLQSTFFLAIMLIIPIFAGAYFYFDNYRQSSYKEKLLQIVADTKSTVSNASTESLTKLFGSENSNVNLILYALLILVFGVFTSLYRFHLKEIAKYEHYLLGFIRIRIAANNSENGFNTEVRQSLTHEAFTYDTKTPLLNKEKRIESPLPGHPSSDIGSSIINKVLDSIEIVTKKKN